MAEQIAESPICSATRVRPFGTLLIVKVSFYPNLFSFFRRFRVDTIDYLTDFSLFIVTIQETPMPDPTRYRKRPHFAMTLLFNSLYL